MDSAMTSLGIPDSRLSSTVGDVVADWTLPPMERWLEVAPGQRICLERLPARTIRIAFQPLYCVQCHKGPLGYVPRGIGIAHAWQVCKDCEGVYAGANDFCHTAEEQDFWDKVHEEMVARFGRGLTQAEIDVLASQGQLGRKLELLDKESPYRVH